jgi:hypothetical protein
LRWPESWTSPPLPPQPLTIATGAISIGMLTAIPALVAALAMILWSAHSDRTKQRMWHIIAPMALAALGWIFVASFKLPDLRMLGLDWTQQLRGRPFLSLLLIAGRGLVLAAVRKPATI